MNEFLDRKSPKVESFSIPINGDLIIVAQKISKGPGKAARELLAVDELRFEDDFTFALPFGEVVL